MKKESQNSLTNILSGIIVVGTLGTVIALNAPKTHIVPIKTVNGDSATFYSASLSNAKPYIEVSNPDGTVKEIFSYEGNDCFFFRDSMGREYRITPEQYSTFSEENPESFVIRDFAEGDSLSDFLIGKKSEFTKYFENARRGFE